MKRSQADRTAGRAKEGMECFWNSEESWGASKRQEEVRSPGHQY
jgi:hypothetical protein